jgi:3-methylcrotonyl-CoA carboxylase alpha subunit
MFQKILIANRSEIACRIIKSAKLMGIETIAVYSSADQNSLHVSLADKAFCIGGPKAIDSYLNIDAILDVAKKCCVDAIHPGYGFLSENAIFAEKCLEAGIIFIGPSISAMNIMASKQLAKQMLEKTNVPLTPGYHGKDQSDETLLKEAKRIGFPVLLKAANGGGGKGMRIVNNAQEFANLLISARRESMASFADDTMLIEKLITNARHVEIQIIADNHGNVRHLFERDCSIQRRHQKIIEEAPAYYLSNKLRNNLAQSAIEVAKSINYQGAGTIEFLVDNEKDFYFMEMNTRLQVEHPITEMITGIDLVEWQIRIAQNEALDILQEDIKASGHAIECRIYAEDPKNNFMPAVGEIAFLQTLTNEYIRIDTGITTNSIISSYYDPMLAKVIAYGKDRDQAILRMNQALNNYNLIGLKNNIDFLKSILKNQAFIDNKINTNFLDIEKIIVKDIDIELALKARAAIDYLRSINTDSLLKDAFSFQINTQSYFYRQYLINENSYKVKIKPITINNLIIELFDMENNSIKTLNLKVKIDDNQSLLILDEGKKSQKILFQKDNNKITIITNNGNIEIFSRVSATNKTHKNKNGQLTAPMPGTIVAVLKNINDMIKSGEPLMVLEAMKMEHTIVAPSDGRISSIFFEIGAQVSEGATLVAMEKI